MTLDVDAIRKAAQEELDQDAHRLAVDRMKESLLDRKERRKDFWREVRSGTSVGLVFGFSVALIVLLIWNSAHHFCPAAN